MRVLVCGSRDFKDRELFYRILDEINQETPIITIIHGAARGADSMSWGWVLSRNQGNPGPDQKGCLQWRVDWKQFGKRAGIVRNECMLKLGKPDLVIAFWDGKSRGTKHMIEIAEKAGVPVKIVEIVDATS